MIEMTFDGNGVAHVILDNPPVNAIGTREIEALSDIIDDLQKRDDLPAVMFASSGRHFSAGADLKMIDAWGTSDRPTDEMVLYSARLQDLFYRVEQMKTPTVAIVRGTAAGAGLELVLACDLCVVEAGARVGLPEVRFGWLASAGGTQRLTARIGTTAALKMMLFDEFIDAQDAYRLGIAQWIAAEADLDAVVHGISERLGRLPKPAVRAVKALVRAGGGNGFAQELLLTRALESEPASQTLFREFLVRKKS